MKILNLLWLAVFFMIATPVTANDDAMARAQYMLRQMNAEMIQLKASQQSLLAEKDALKKDFDKLQKKYDGLTSKSEKNKQAMKGKVSEIKQRYKEEVTAHNETRKQLKEIIQEKNRLFNVATEQTRSLDLCVGNNEKLYTINREILSQYEEKGVWDSVTQAEPFSGLTQVQIENLVDDYQYRLDDLRVGADL